MRFIAWFLVAVVLIVGGLLGYCLYAAELGLEARGVQVVPAAQMAETFETLRRQVQDGGLLGTAFSEDPLGEMGDYAFHIYTVQVTNRGFLPADWIQLSVSPISGDALQMDPETANMLPALQSGALQATVLSQAAQAAPRDLRVTYFVFGRPYSITVRQP